MLRRLANQALAQTGMTSIIIQKLSLSTWRYRNFKITFMIWTKLISYLALKALIIIYTFNTIIRTYSTSINSIKPTRWTVLAITRTILALPTDKFISLNTNFAIWLIKTALARCYTNITYFVILIIFSRTCLFTLIIL